MTGRGILKNNGPENILFPGTYDGVCWDMVGSYGQVGVRLGSIITVTAVTIDHVHLHATRDPGCAPRNIEVWASLSLTSSEDVLRIEGNRRNLSEIIGDPLPSGTIGPSKKYLKLFSFTYNVYSSSSVQKFTVPRSFRKLEIASTSVIFRVVDNWGSESHTCLYRVRVHGKEMNGL